jgi:glutathione S-transferase
MKLYHDPASTTSRIVSFFLFDNDIPFDEAIVTTAAGEQHDPQLKILNPNGQVPVLVDDNGFTLTESGAIIRYLACKHQLGVYPAGIEARTRVEEAMNWFQTNFHVYHCVMLAYTYILPPLQSLEPGVLATIRHMGQQGSQRYLKVLNDHMIGASPYVCGARMTLADYVGAANVTLGYFAGVDLAPYPNVVRWLDTLRSRKGWAPAYSIFEAALTSSRRGALSHAA